MPPSVMISALGSIVSVALDGLGEADADEVRRAWSDAAPTEVDPIPVAHRSVILPADDDPAVRLAALTQHVTLAAIGARRGELWMLHAGAVADEQGRVVAFVGPSGRGKTTASRALGRTWAYVTDETVGIDADGVVWPYRKPLSIIEGRAAKTQRAPGELGLGELPERPLRLAAIVLLDRSDDAPDRPTVSAIGLSEALPELIEQTSFLSDVAAPLRTISALAASTGGIRRVSYREAETLPAVMNALFVDPASIEHIPARHATPTDPSTAGWFRSGTLDAVDIDEDVAVFLPALPDGATLQVISGVAPSLWRAADGVDLDRLVSAAVDAHGMPADGDPATAVRAALESLSRAGVLADGPSWRIRDDVAWTGSADRVVVLPLAVAGAPMPLALEGSAALIWSVVADGRVMTRSAITAEVALRAGADAAALDADVGGFLTALDAAGVLECIAP